MEVKKIDKTELITAGREALSKVHDFDVLDNITLTLAMIIGAGLKTGYRVKLPFCEFSDFSELITKVTKTESYIAVISISRNPPIDVLISIRRLTDNAIHSITNVDKTLINETVIYLLGIKPERREKYAIDYATKLL